MVHGDGQGQFPRLLAPSFLHEVGDLVAREVHRRRLRWRPEHAPDDAADAGTEPAAANGSRVMRARRRELVGGGS